MRNNATQLLNIKVDSLTKRKEAKEVSQTQDEVGQNLLIFGIFHILVIEF